MVQEVIDKFFNPKNIACVGASDKEGKIGNIVINNLKSFEKGKVFPIHPKADKIYGMKCYPSVLDVEDDIDLAIIVIPAKFVPSVVDECAEKGIKAVLIISSGFSETGRLEDVEREEKIKKTAKENDMKIVGPNCFGIYNMNVSLNASIALGTPTEAGNVSFLTQSGAYGMAIFAFAQDREMKFSKVMAHGNKAAIEDYEVLDYYMNDDETDVICLFLESLDKGREFFDVAKECAKKKPIVATKVGRTEGAKKAAASHTSAMSGEFTAYETAFNQSGIILAKSGLEMVNVGRMLSVQPLPTGKKVGIITNSGGTGVELTDLLEESGMKVPILSDETQEKISEVIPKYASPQNPVDVTPVPSMFPKMYSRTIEALYEDPDVDIIVPILLQRSGIMKENVEAVKDTILRLQKDIPKPAAVCWVTPQEHYDKREILESNGIPTYEWPDRTALVLSQICDYVDFLKSRDVDIKSIKWRGGKDE